MKKQQQNATILIDLHHTLLNEHGLINKELAISMDCLKAKYDIVLFTASLLNNEQLAETKKMLKDNGIEYTKLYAIDTKIEEKAPDLELDNDVSIKLALYGLIKTKYDVKILVDNNKAVCKEFRKLGVYCLRAMEAK